MQLYASWANVFVEEDAFFPEDLYKLANQSAEFFLRSENVLQCLSSRQSIFVYTLSQRPLSTASVDVATHRRLEGRRQRAKDSRRSQQQLHTLLSNDTVVSHDKKLDLQSIRSERNTSPPEQKTHSSAAFQKCYLIFPRPLSLCFLRTAWKSYISECRE